MSASIYTDAIGDAIIEHLSEGGTLTAWCRMSGVGRRTVADWRAKDPEFAARYEQAMLEGCHALLDESLTIADDITEDAASRKVRIWARHELMARKRPDEFGKTRMEHTGKDGAPLAGVSDEQLDARLSALLAKQG